MSFSGLKTAVKRERDRLVGENSGLQTADVSDLSAGFQIAVADVFSEKSRRAITDYLEMSSPAPAFAVAGGVAANRTIRAALETVSNGLGVRFMAPPLELCTDNAAMIAWVGLERFRAGLFDDLTLGARPRWPLDTANPSYFGSGKKGAKA